MIMKISTIHEVEDEAEFVRGVESVGHTNYEGTVVTCAHQTQHDPLVQCQCLPLLHLDPLLVQTLKHTTHQIRDNNIYE